MAGAAGIFAPAFAAETAVDEQNSLPSYSSVTWDEDYENIADIKYTYSMPSDYTATSDRIDGTSDSTNYDKNLFENIRYSSGSYGGAIYNIHDNVNIISDFKNNSINNSGYGNIYAQGGAVYNEGSIGNIAGAFISNRVTGESYSAYDSAYRGYAYGGAICNKGSIENISGDFINNSSDASAYSVAKGYAYGGAIYNEGTIGTITANFVRNNISSSTGFSYGAAIYNTGTINNIVNSNFIGNTLFIHGGGVAGAAIYTTKDLNIIADNGKSEFTGNQATYDRWTPEKEAIYVGSSGVTLTFKAVNNGEIILNDYVNSYTGYAYNAKLTGDETGTIKLYNDLKNANVTTDNVNIDMADGKIHKYTFRTLNSDASSKYKIDIDFTNKTADTIDCFSNSSGVVTIDSLNVLGELPEIDGEEYKIRILNGSSNIQLALSDYVKSQLPTDEYYIGDAHEFTYEDIRANTNWNDTYLRYAQLTHLYGHMGLATTRNTNDSIGVSVSRTELGEKTSEKLGDSLALWTGLETDEVKNFNFGSADDVHTLEDYLHNQYGQQLNINGVAEGEKRSTIDFASYQGFKIQDNSKFGAKNVEFKNALDGAIASRVSSIDLSNVKFSQNYNRYSGGAISVYHEGNINYEEFDLNNTNVNYNTDVNSSVFVNNISEWGMGGAIALGYRLYFYAGSQQPQSVDNSNNVSFTDWVQKTIALNINDSLFDSNFANAGGAVAVYRDIYDESSGWGGGVASLVAASQATSVNPGVLNIKNSKFINNIAAYSEPEVSSARSLHQHQALGGAICSNAKTNIEGSLFDSNRVVNGNGGAIYLAPGQQYNYSGGLPESLSIAAMALDNDSLISSQNADEYIVYENGSTPESSDVLTIKNTSFINNSVENTEPITPEQYMNYIWNYGDDETYYELDSLFMKEAEKLGYTDPNDIPQDVQEQIVNNVISEYQGYKDFQNLFANGGAIYSGANTKVSADGADVLFKNNRVINNGNEVLNDIYMLTTVGNSNNNYSPDQSLDGEAPLDLVTLTLDARNGGTIMLNGTIDGGIYKVDCGGLPAALADDSGIQAYDSLGDYEPNPSGTPVSIERKAAYNLNITGDGTGKVVFGNSVKNASIMTYDGSMSVLAKDSNWDNNILALNGGTISMVNNSVGTSNLNRMIVVKDTNFVADVDLANKEMDRFRAKEYGEHFGNLNVSGMNLLSDATDPKTEIYFAQEGLKDNVTTTVTEVAYTPIYKYNVRYENRDGAGYFVFDRTGGGSNGNNPSDAFNPSVLSTPVSSVAAAQATINETFKYVFEHADAFTQMPYSQRMAQINSNKYAISTDFNGNRGSLCYDHNNKAAWFRPYATL